MNRKTSLAAAAITASVLAVSGLTVANAQTSTSTAAHSSAAGRVWGESATARHEKQQVLALLAAYTSGDTSAFNVINPKKFIQHDPAIADGLSGLKAWLAAAPTGSIVVHPVRVLVDGTYVFVHSETDLPTGKTTSWDIFRFEQGKIVEHWDSRQPLEPANGAGHTELDGPTQATDLGATAATKRLAWTAMTDFLIDGDVSVYGEPMWNADGYIQHSEGANSDGIAGSKPILTQWIEDGTLVYNKIEKVLGEGDFALVISQGSFAGTPYSYYDFFRMAHGQIIEHWDILQPLTPIADAKNTNAQFDFPQDEPAADLY